MSKTTITTSSSATAKPTITAPANGEWTNSVYTTILQWSHQENLESVTIEITRTSDGKKFNYTETSANSATTITQFAPSSKYGFPASGAFTWRVKAKSWARAEWSEYTSARAFGIDPETPSIIGIDIVVPHGNGAEEHSALEFESGSITGHGIFIGREDGKVTVLVRNTGTTPMTVWGTSPSSISVNSSDKARSWTQTTSFAFVVEPNGYVSSSTDDGRSLQFEIHQTNIDLYGAAIPTALPTAASDYEVAPQVYLGRTLTPPYAMAGNILKLIVNHSQERILSNSCVRADKTNNSFTDGYVGSYITFAGHSSAKVGDLVALGSSHRSTPDGKSILGFYRVSAKGTDSIKLDNFQYANSFSAEFAMPAVDTWTVEEDDYGRYIATATASGHNWGTMFETGTDLVQYPIESNSFSGRWLGLKDDINAIPWTYYPIYMSDGATITVVGNPQDDFVSGTVLDAVVTGDEVAIMPDMFIGELSNALVYVGVASSLSGIDSVSLKRKTQSISTAEDPLGNTIDITQRQALDGNFPEQDYSQLFFPLNYTSGGSSKYMEIGAVVRNNAGTLSASSWADAYYSSCRSSSFKTLLTDTTAPKAEFTANLNAKHLTTLRPNIDFIPSTDNVEIAQWDINESGAWIGDYTAPSMTWQRVKMDKSQSFTIATIETSEEYPGLLVSTLEEEPGHDIINSFAKFNGYSPVLEVQILDVLDNKRVLLGSDSELIKEDVEFTVDSYHSYPDIGYEDAGLITSIYVDDSSEENFQNYDSFSAIQGLANFSECVYSDSLSALPSAYDYPYGYRAFGYVYAAIEGQYKISWSLTGKADIYLNDIKVSSGDIKQLSSGWHKLRIEYVGQPGQALSWLKFGFKQSSGFASAEFDATSATAASNAVSLVSNTEIEAEQTFPGKVVYFATALFSAGSASASEGKISVTCDTTINRTHCKYVVLNGDFTPRRVFWDTMGVSSSTTLLVADNGITPLSGQAVALDYYLELESGSSTSMEFAAGYEGAVTSVEASGSYVIVYDENADWNVNQFAGANIAFDSDTKWGVVIENTANTATIEVKNRSGVDVAPVAEQSFVIGVPSGNTYELAIANGVPQVVPSSDNIVHRCASLTCSVRDWYGNQSTSTKYFSLLGANVSDSSNVNGGIIDYNLTNDQWNFTSMGTTVYDATFVNVVKGVYVSRPMPGPAGFRAWREAQWTATIPAGATLTVEVRTASDLASLESAQWNRDAYDNYSQPWETTEDNYTGGGTYDGTVSSAYAADISSFTYNGNLDDSRRKWIQYRLVFTSNSSGSSPSLSSFKLTYSSTQERVVLFKNVTLDKEIAGGFLSANTDIPTGCEIEWGISTDNSTDFETFQPIPVDEAFRVVAPATQYRLGARLISSDSSAPKIYDFSFMYDTGSTLHQPNVSLYS